MNMSTLSKNIQIVSVFWASEIQFAAYSWTYCEKKYIQSNNISSDS